MKNDEMKAMSALLSLALKDLDATSDHEIRAEFAAEGEDAEDVARAMATRLDEVAAMAMRERATAAKAEIKPAAALAALRPSMERMKWLIEEAFRANPNLATAFREGTRQSDTDLQSLYDDLVRLGKIDPERHGD